MNFTENRKVKLFNYMIIIFLGAGLCCCKKKQYPESRIDGEPVFYFKAQMDGVPLTLEAGKNGYYMFASHKQDYNFVYNFSAELRQSSCTGCSPRLIISVNDRQVSAPAAPVQIDNALQPDVYPFVAGPAYEVAFKARFNKPSASFAWNFGDGNSSVYASPTHTYSRAGKYNVSVNVTAVGSACQSFISNTEAIDSSSCSLSIQAAANGNILSFSTTAVIGTPASFYWEFGDGATSILSNPAHAYALPGSYPVKLRVISTKGDTAWARYNAVTQTDNSSCAANYSITSITPVLPKAFSGVRVTWVDELGAVYTSDHELQPNSSNFEILSVENFESNEQGEPTKKLKVRFNCRVYKGKVYKTISNAEAVICVSYK